jgi:hypothetical protein
MKHYRITADYRPKNPNKPTYDFKINGDTSKIKDSVLKKEVKKYFENIVPWLKVYRVEEITEEQCSEWIFRTLKVKE